MYTRDNNICEEFENIINYCSQCQNNKAVNFETNELKFDINHPVTLTP